MSSTRKLARLAAPVVCAAYVAYVAIDRGYYHIERRKELDAATARIAAMEEELAALRAKNSSNGKGLHSAEPEHSSLIDS